MRGQPPFQAIVLLIVLAALGFAGSQYISNDKSVSVSQLKPPEASEGKNIDAEVELVFSSPPLSYQLIKPSKTGKEDTLLLEFSKPTENPCYGDIQLTANQLSIYWLNVRWKDKPDTNTHHFVRINISPSHGESRSYTFFTSYRGLDETFEYSTGDHQDE